MIFGISAGLFIAAVLSAVRADRIGEAVKRFEKLGLVAEETEYDLKESAWEILAVVFFSISITLLITGILSAII